MDKYQLDSTKLMFHPRRVAKWLDSAYIYPLYVEISPTGACNHRCKFCAFDFLEYKSQYLDTRLLKGVLSDMAQSGVKSIMFGGEGEPLLHKDIVSLAKHAHEVGLDVAVTTNGSLLARRLDLIDYCSWIKISVDAGKASTYADIHGVPRSAFDELFDGIALAVEIRDAHKFPCTIGLQMLLLDDNKGEELLLAKKADRVGADYVVVKPYSRHPGSKHDPIESPTRYSISGRAGVPISSSHPKLIYRIAALNRPERDYSTCLALPFWAYISSNGDVWNCSARIPDEEFRLGNIYVTQFNEIWGKHLKGCSVTDCRHNCRMEDCNQYLWQLREELPEHVNFI